MNARKVVISLLEALDAHDPAGATARLATEMRVAIPPLGVRDGGRADAEAFLAEMLGAFPDLRLTVRHLVVTDDVVTAELKVEGTQASDYAGAINQEKHVDVDQAWRLEVTDGLVSGLEAYWCHQQLLRRLGVKRFDQVALV